MFAGAQSLVQPDGPSSGETGLNWPSITSASGPPGLAGDVLKLILEFFNRDRILCITNIRKGGNSSKNPTASVKKPGVRSKAPAKRSIAPWARGSVGSFVF